MFAVMLAWVSLSSHGILWVHAACGFSWGRRLEMFFPYLGLQRQPSAHWALSFSRFSPSQTQVLKHKRGSEADFGVEQGYMEGSVKTTPDRDGVRFNIHGLRRDLQIEQPL